MKETDLNLVIKNSFIDGGLAYKIPDPPQTVAVMSNPRPFDGFAVGNFGTLFWEAKFQREYKAFSFSHIQPHQIENLTKISNLKKEKVYPLIILGIWESRKYFDIFLFHIDFINELIKKGKSSIIKVELLELKEKYAIPVKNKLFSIDGFEDKIIKSLNLGIDL